MTLGSYIIGIAAAVAAQQSGMSAPAGGAAVSQYDVSIAPELFVETAATMRKKGVTVNPTEVRMITPGVDKDSIYNFIGPPHFGEGIARTWNYVLFFSNGTGAERTRCRMQIRFHRPDDASSVVVQQVFWQRKECADIVAAAV